MTKKTWNGGDGAWSTAADWLPTGAPGASDAAVVSSGDPQIDSAITIASLIDSATVTFANAGASRITGALNVAGVLNLDAATGQGGSNLTVGGVLTNTGIVQLGAADNSLSKADTVKVAHIANSIGVINVDGGSSAAKSMLLDVTSGVAGFGTAGAVSGAVSVAGHAKIEFVSGQLTTILSQASLVIDGAQAFVADGAANANNALTGLALVAGALELKAGATLTTAGALNNINSISLYSGSAYAGAAYAGASLTVGGALSNSGQIFVSGGQNSGSRLAVKGRMVNSGSLYVSADSTLQTTEVSATGLTNISAGYGGGAINLSASLPTVGLALLDVTAAAGFGTLGVLSGNVSLAGDSAIEFASGEIGSIQFGASLSLSGSTARIADATAIGSNSALTGLRTVAGRLSLLSGASISLSGGLDNSGAVSLDSQSAFGGDGGSNLSVGGVLTNSGYFNLGASTLTGSDKVSVKAIDNTGSLTLVGSSSAPERAVFAVAAAAGFGVAGQLTGAVTVQGDALIEFASGQIDTIDAGASLDLTGAQAYVGDGLATSNSALKGLANVMGGLQLNGGAAVATTGALSNGGTISVDAGFVGSNSPGGSSLTIGGVLTNADSLSIGNTALTAATTVKATGLHNTGTITMVGGAAAADRALLDITAGAAGFGTAGALSGDVSLSGAAAIEFVSGQITSIASGASLTLTGARAFISDGAPTANSALKGLATVAGNLSLANGASLAATGGLTSTGSLTLDSSSFQSVGGSRLTINGVLTNGGNLAIGNSSATAASDTLTATGLVNNIGGSVDLQGDGTSSAILNVTGAITNNGTFLLSNDSQHFTTAVGGSGAFELSNQSKLEFDAGVSSGQNIDFFSSSELVLGAASTFAASINSFAAGDSVQALKFGTGTTIASVVENGSSTGVILTLKDGAAAAQLNFIGSYVAGDFHLAVAATSSTLTFV